MALITLKEYSLRYGRNPAVLRQKAERGGFQTAQKMGRDWMIDEDEPLVDNRVKSGRYIDWRKNTGRQNDEKQPSNEPQK